VYVSSPKNHAQPVGLFNDESVKETASGAIPVVGVPVKSATGTAAAGPTQIRIKRIAKIPISIFFLKSVIMSQPLCKMPENWGCSGNPHTALTVNVTTVP
jgi:hypothetical protein